MVFGVVMTVTVVLSGWVIVNVVPAMAVIVPLARGAGGTLAWPLDGGAGQADVSVAAPLPAAAVGAGTGVFVAAVPPPQAVRSKIVSATATAMPVLRRMAKHLPR